VCPIAIVEQKVRAFADVVVDGLEDITFRDAEASQHDLAPSIVAIRIAAPARGGSVQISRGRLESPAGPADRTVIRPAP
jgi:hypothetical protein